MSDLHELSASHQLRKWAAEQPGGPANRDALASAALDSGTGSARAASFKSLFGDGRRDGAAALHSMSYAEGCNCFTYAGP